MTSELLKYDYTFEPGSNHSGAYIAELVPKNTSVLEVGAGAGSVSRALIDWNGCEVTAVEIDDASLERLRQICGRVVKADLNDASWPDELGSKQYDVVVFGDVLEHLYDPVSALRAASKLLQPGGCVVVSIPHVGHNGVVSSLLLSDFDYRESGLLDKTHVRFFGVKNIQDLVENSGLKIVDVKFVIQRPEHTEWSSFWYQLPSETRKILDQSKYGSVYQVVVKAVPVFTSGNSINITTIGPEATSIAASGVNVKRKSVFSRWASSARKRGLIK